MKKRLKSAEKENFVEKYATEAGLLTLQEVAEIACVSVPTVSSWFAQKTHPRPRPMTKLCTYFKCKRQDLLKRRETGN